jgi:hypothetical protein
MRSAFSRRRCSPHRTSDGAKGLNLAASDVGNRDRSLAEFYNACAATAKVVPVPKERFQLNVESRLIAGPAKAMISKASKCVWRVGPWMGFLGGCSCGAVTP